MSNVFSTVVLIALMHDVSHLNARTLNDGMIAWSHSLLGGGGGNCFKMAFRRGQLYKSDVDTVFFTVEGGSVERISEKKKGVVLSGRKAELAERCIVRGSGNLRSNRAK